MTLHSRIIGRRGVFAAIGLRNVHGVHHVCISETTFRTAVHYQDWPVFCTWVPIR